MGEVGGSKTAKKNSDVFYGWLLTAFVKMSNLKSYVWMFLQKWFQPIVCGLLESLLLYKSKPTIACLHIIKTQLSLTHPGSNMVKLCKIKLSLKRGKITKCWNLDLSNN